MDIQRLTFYNIFLTYLKSRFFLMMTQTRVFPTISTVMSADSTVAMAILSGSDITERFQS